DIRIADETARGRQIGIGRVDRRRLGAEDTAERSVGRPPTLAVAHFGKDVEETGNGVTGAAGKLADGGLAEGRPGGAFADHDPGRQAGETERDNLSINYSAWAADQGRRFAELGLPDAGLMAAGGRE